MIFFYLLDLIIALVLTWEPVDLDPAGLEQWFPPFLPLRGSFRTGPSGPARDLAWRARLEGFRQWRGGGPGKKPPSRFCCSS